MRATSLTHPEAGGRKERFCARTAERMPLVWERKALFKAPILTEHFYHEGGLSYTRALLLKSSLESGSWTVREIIPYGPSSTGGRLGVWYATKRRQSVLVLLLELSDGSAGVVSFCSL